MIRVTFLNFVIMIYAFDIRDSNIERKINKTLKTQNISETTLLLDLQTFVSYNGLRRDPSDGPSGADSSKPGLRMNPKYFPPNDMDHKLRVLDLMRQHVYTTQERMMALEPILKKYENDPALRMAFIYNRLRQLIIDLRRLYTISFVHKKSPKHPIYLHMFWYSHMVRKYFDVIYIVEHTIDLYKEHSKKINYDEY